MWLLRLSFLGQHLHLEPGPDLPSTTKSIFFVGYLEILYRSSELEPTKMMVMVVNGTCIGLVCIIMLGKKIRVSIHHACPRMIRAKEFSIDLQL